MKKIDTIVVAPHFYTMEGAGVGYHSDAAMAVDGGKILKVGNRPEILAEYTAEEMITLDHHMVLPGFIDGHMHTACNIMRGLAQDTNSWMMFGLQPFDNAVNDEERDAGSRVAILEAVRAGTTTLGDYDSKMENVCAFIDKVGARGNIAQTIRAAKRRVYQPGELYEFDDAMGEESLNRNIDLYNKWNNKAGGRIKILFGPQGADFVSPEMLLRIQKAVKERGTKSLIAVHLTDCTDEEAALIAKRGASMIVNPGSIGIIDGIVCPSVVFQQAGGVVALGSDQAPGNNCHNIINEMKNVCLFNKIKYQNPEVMPAWKALRMATIEGAQAIGLGDTVGSLEPGKCADYIAIDLSCPSMLPVYTYPMRNMVPNLVYSARGSEVSLVAVDGKVIMRDGAFTYVDEKEYLNEISKYPDDIGRRAADEFFSIDGTNAHFMREDKL